MVFEGHSVSTRGPCRVKAGHPGLSQRPAAHQVEGGIRVWEQERGVWQSVFQRLFQQSRCVGWLGRGGKRKTRD